MIIYKRVIYLCYEPNNKKETDLIYRETIDLNNIFKLKISVFLYNNYII